MPSQTSFGCSTLFHVFFVYVVESCSGCSKSFKLFCTLMFVALDFHCGCYKNGFSGPRVPKVHLKC